MRDPNQKMRFTDAELGLIKGLFAGNDDLLYALRKAMLQLPMSPSEQSLLKQVINEQTSLILNKTFNPWLDGDSPFFQMTSLKLALGADTKTLDPDRAWPYIKAKEIEINYIAQQLRIICGSEEKPKILLSDLEDLSGDMHDGDRAVEVYVNTMAWHFMLSFVDSNVQQLKFLAGLKDETVEETKIRLAKNSNK